MKKDLPNLDLIHDILAQLEAHPYHPTLPRPPLRKSGYNQTAINRHLSVLEQASLLYFAPGAKNWESASITDGGRELLALLSAATNSSRSKKERDHLARVARWKLDWSSVFTYHNPPKKPERFMSVDHARSYFLARCLSMGAELGLDDDTVEAKYQACKKRLQPYPPDAGVALPAFDSDVWNPMTILKEDYRRVMVEAFAIKLEATLDAGVERLKVAGWNIRPQARGGAIDPEMRYDWATKHLCFGLTYRDIAANEKRMPSLKTAKGIDKRTEAVRTVVETVKKDIHWRD